MSSRSPVSVSSSRVDPRSAEAAEAERESRESEADRAFALHVLTREVNWKVYETNNVITNKELGLILDYDKQSASDQADLMMEKGPIYCGLFVKCLQEISSRDTVEYLIVLIDELLHFDPARAAFFHQTATAQTATAKGGAFAPFIKILTTPGLGYHNYVISRTAHILSLLLATASSDQVGAAGSQFVKFIIDRLIDSNSSARDYIHALKSLKPLLIREQFQSLFADHNGVKVLLELLNKDTQNAQLIYSIGFNLWLLSYNPSVSKLLSDLGVVKKLVSLLKIQVMVKVIRIIFSTLRNLLSHNEDSFAEELIGLGMLGVIETLSKRKFKDEDIAPDMEFVKCRLEETIVKLSNFAVYQSEVMSGNLSWTPVHKNEVFWRENFTQFEQKNWKLVQKLIELLADEDENVREIACFDLGEVARFHPDGKKVIAKLGGKAKLMANLQSTNQKIQKAALLATQKLMVANWEFLAKSSAGGVAALVQKSKQ